jgi:hypothetical protein
MSLTRSLLKYASIFLWGIAGCLLAAGLGCLVGWMCFPSIAELEANDPHLKMIHKAGVTYWGNLLGTGLFAGFVGLILGTLIQTIRLDRLDAAEQSEHSTQ